MAKKKNNITCYNKYQKYVSSFCKKNNIKLGKKFGAYTSKVYQKTKDISLKDVKKSIDALFYLHSGYLADKPVQPLKRIFDERIPFYNVCNTFTTKKKDAKYQESFSAKGEYDGVTIKIKRFKDGGIDEKFSGTAEDFVSWYVDSGIYAFLRNYFSSSPFALFELIDSDNETYAEYEIITPHKMGDEPPPLKLKEPKVSKKVLTEKELELKITKEKIKLAKEESIKIEKKSKLIESFKSAGFTVKEIKKELDKLD